MRTSSEDAGRKLDRYYINVNPVILIYFPCHLGPSNTRAQPAFRCFIPTS
jgi:hypothetical protein